MKKLAERLLRMPTSAVLLLILSSVCTIGLIAIGICTENVLIFSSGFIVLIFTFIFFIGVSWFRVEKEEEVESPTAEEEENWRNS